MYAGGLFGKWESGGGVRGWEVETGNGGGEYKDVLTEWPPPWAL